MQQKISVREARQNISRLLDAIAAGDEFVITRRDKPAAKLSSVSDNDLKPLRFPNRSKFRAKLPKCQVSGSRLIREMRNERG